MSTRTPTGSEVHDESLTINQYRAEHNPGTVALWLSGSLGKELRQTK